MILFTRDKIQKNRIEQAISWIKGKSDSKEVSNFQIVSKLSFGFWTTLFNKEMAIFGDQHLSKIFRNDKPIQRKRYINSTL